MEDELKAKRDGGGGGGRDGVDVDVDVDVWLSTPVDFFREEGECAAAVFLGAMLGRGGVVRCVCDQKGLGRRHAVVMSAVDGYGRCP